MENYNTIEYKWEHGIYQLDDLVEMVQKGFINEKEFFNSIIGKFCFFSFLF